ncbi:hypothetical protein CL658_01955 [bacterium]|nr:hypothetical protein [bacterium]
MYIYQFILSLYKVCFIAGILIFSFNSIVFSIPVKPFLGIGFSEFKKDNVVGIEIDYIVPNSVADKSKLQKGDIIYMIDYQHLATSNVSENFKRYIQDEKNIDEQLVIHYFRDTLTISKDIDGDFINVDYNLNKVLLEVNQLIPNKDLSFKFDRKIEQHIEKITLESKPLLRTTSPNLSLDLFPSIDYIAPYYSELIDVLKIYEGFDTHFKSMETSQFHNEFWDDGLRFPLIRYLHIHYDKLPSFTRLFQQELGVVSPLHSFMLQQRLMDSIVSIDALVYPKSKSFKDHYDFITLIINQSNQLLDKALIKLSDDERQFILKHTPIIMNQLSKGFIIAGNDAISDHALNTYFMLIKNIDMNSLFMGYSYLLQLGDHDWLDNLSKSIGSMSLIESNIEGISGSLYFSAKTDFGLFVIAGKDDNTYTTDISFLIDLGGNDTYRNNAGAYYKDHYINVLIDLDGNDLYSSTSEFSQGSGFMGYGLLLDYKGDDLYRGVRLSQGAGIFGCGSVIDFYGDDSYIAQDFSQGIGLAGNGFIYDRRGDDYFNASLFSQAVGLTYGVGSIFDFSGNDSYFLGNREFSSYGSVGVFKGAGQGFGFGFRHSASGGIGFLYDHKGHDQYEAGNFSQGTGYFYGLGILFDDQGDDTYIGSRYSIATSAHSALGIFKDRRGDDSYQTIYGSSIAIAWDNSNSFFLDEEGHDRYNCLDRNFCLAEAHYNSFAIFNDKNGKDTYLVNFNKNLVQKNNDTMKNFAIYLDEGGDHDIYLGVDKLNNISKNPKNSFLFLDLKKTLANYLRQL